MENILAEAFKQLRLTEEVFDLTADAGKVDELKSFVADDIDMPDEEEIVDVSAMDEDDLQDSYEGMAILECPNCRAKLFKDVENVKVEGDLANKDDRCPVCANDGGFKILGKVAKFEEEHEEEEEEEETEEIDEGLSLADRIARKHLVKEETENEPIPGPWGNLDKVDESKKGLNEFDRDAISDIRSECKYEENLRDTLERTKEDMYDQFEILGGENLEAAKPTIDKIVEKAWAKFHKVDESKKCEALEDGWSKHEIKSHEDAVKYGKGTKWMIALDSDKGQAFFDDYADDGYKFVALDNGIDTYCVAINGDDYSIYNKFGHQIDSIEGIDDIKSFISLHEELDDADIPEDELKESLEVKATDEENVEVHKEDDGSMTISTKANTADEEIVPFTPEEQEEIENQDEEAPEDEVEEVEEETIDELGESFLKQVYSNVSGFKSNKIYNTDESIIVEGLITYNSGATRPTKFEFTEAKRKKNGKIVLEGKNNTFSAGNKAFFLSGRLNGKKLIGESLVYRFTVKSLNEGVEKTSRVYGRATVRK